MPESQTHCDGVRIKALNNIYHEVKILFYLSVQMSILRIFMYDVTQKVEKVFKFMYIYTGIGKKPIRLRQIRIGPQLF